MMSTVLNKGPLATGIKLYSTFKSYHTGVYECPNDVHEKSRGVHAITIVGYGEEINRKSKKLEKYWIVRNSWGTFFNFLMINQGDKNYFKN